MTNLETLQRERDKYDMLMGAVLNWELHLKKADEEVKPPLSEIQKQKNIFLFKYYETKFIECEELIRREINKK